MNLRIVEVDSEDEISYGHIYNCSVAPSNGDSIWAWDHRKEKEWEGTAKLLVVDVRYGIYKEESTLEDVMWCEVMVRPISAEEE